VSVLIAASVARTCLGDDRATFDALLRGASGVEDLRYFPSTALNVRRGYHLPWAGPERPLPASAWLAECVAEALARAGVDARHQRVTALVGSGLRELRAVERWATGGTRVRRQALHFTGALRQVAPRVEPVLTISNACSAGGCALALGQDLLELGDADAVVVAGTDAMTESMLAMIGRFHEEPTDQVRPFDVHRTGVLLGEGAAALVLVPEGGCADPVARLLGTGLSCDAWHETAPDRAGIRAAMVGALGRAGRAATGVDLVYAHGTGTGLNDPAEAAVLAEVFAGAVPGPLVTAVKGAVGHTSGASALTSVAMAVQSLRRGVAPPVVGLREPVPEGAGLRFVIGRPQPAALRLVQVNAFGFGGVNAVSLLESAAGGVA
jgi:3-oxoacyl-[acyl-carrier-protein] synthase II